MQTILHRGVLLRPFQPTDAAAFADAVRESVQTVGRWMSWCHADYTPEQALEWFALCDQSRAEGVAHEYGIYDAQSSELLGGVGLNHFNLDHNFCNLGYWVRQSMQGRGIATRGAHAITGFGFETLQLTRIEIVAAVGNAASSAVAVKLGAQLECLARNRLIVHGEPVDAHVHSLLPSDFSASAVP
jgi:RimJ/RimL family protein N-acetyltransferase